MMKLKTMNTKEIKMLQRVYAVRLALAETLKEKANEIEQKLLDTHTFKDKEGNVITDIKDTYLICDEDNDRFYELRKIEMRKAGLGHPQDNEGRSVDCVADFNVSKMKNRIFDYVMANLPKDMADTLEFGKFKTINGKFVFDNVVDNFMLLKA